MRRNMVGRNAATRLELTWIGKENRPRLEPRVLLEDSGKSYHAKHRVTDHDIFDNRLIFGDNLLALKALEGEFTGKSKCIYIDPPYNTSSAFTHYDDGVEHSLWLSFQSDPERKLSVILEREAMKWFKPAKGQFQIFYKWAADHPEYQPDFVAETSDCILMLEAKAKNELNDAIVLAKRDVAVQWCKRASAYAESYGGKSWLYLLIPHDAISDNKTVKGLCASFEVAPPL